MKNVIICDGEYRNIKNCIRTTASGITKCLSIHHFLKGRIEEVNNSNDPILNLVSHIFHEPSKIHVAFCRCNPMETAIFAIHY